MKRKRLSLLLVLLMLLSCLSGCAGQTKAVDANTIDFTDSSGRHVKLPAEITRIAPSGAVATMILSTIAPEYMVSVSNSPSSSQYHYLPKELIELPTTGQMYGSKSTINLEALLDAQPQVIIDLGDPKDGIADDMDSLQKQTNIPTIFIEADLIHMASAYRTLGSLLSGKAQRGGELADFVNKTVKMAAENSAKIPEGNRLSVMYTTGSSGLNTNAQGSSQAQVIELVGARNAIVVDNVSSKGGGNTINMEQLYKFKPDVILFTTGSVYTTAAQDPQWLELKAIKNNNYYEIPGLPYCWMSSPPSINMVLGIWWLGNLLYPEVYDYDMTEKTKEIYKLFWNDTLTDQQISDMLSNSTLKRAEPGQS